MTQSELQALPLGTMIRKRYAVVGIVGRGGLGTVYRVEDSLFDKKTVYAVKELVDQSRGARKQFSQEAKWLQALNHPHIPKVHEYFEWESRAYLVMDFIEGENLEQKLTHMGGRPLEEEEVLRWILPICDALNYLHRREPPILHRDVKPANIIVSPAEHPVLVDLGIAKEHLPGANRTATFIRKAGTEGYAPPEQYIANGQTGPWSDVYALGATLYELLTGCLPPTAVERVALETTLLPPKTLNTAISAHVSNAIVSALALRPNDRFQYVADFASALLGPDPSPARHATHNASGTYDTRGQASIIGPRLSGANGFAGSGPRGLPVRPAPGMSSPASVSGGASELPAGLAGAHLPEISSWPRSGGTGPSNPGTSLNGTNGRHPSVPGSFSPAWAASQPNDFSRSNLLLPSTKSPAVSGVSAPSFAPRTSGGNMRTHLSPSASRAGGGGSTEGAVAVAEAPKRSRRGWLIPAMIALILAVVFGTAVVFHAPIVGLFQHVDQSTPQATINGYFHALSQGDQALAWRYAAANQNHTQTETAFDQGLAADNVRLGRVTSWKIIQVSTEDPNDDIATVQVWRSASPSTPVNYTIVLTQFGTNIWLIGNVSSQ